MALRHHLTWCSIRVATSFILFFAYDISISSSNAGFFEDLFAGSRQQTVVVAPDADRRTADRRKHVVNHGGSDHAARRRFRLSYIPRQMQLTRHRKSLASQFNGADAYSQKARSVSANAGLCYSGLQRGDDPDQSYAILHDSTLRAGDSVMTAEGVRIFNGRNTCPHKTTEFLALSDTRDLSMAKSGALAAMDNAMKSQIRNGQAGSFINTPEDAVTYKP